MGETDTKRKDCTGIGLNGKTQKEAVKVRVKNK